MKGTLLVVQESVKQILLHLNTKTVFIIQDLSPTCLLIDSAMHSTVVEMLNAELESNIMPVQT